MHESGVQWTTLSILRRGTDPRNFDQCPPTIVITALDAEPLKQQAWRSVESKIRTELGKHKDIGIQVEIIHDVPVLFHGQDMGVPYPFPRPIGYSLGVSMEGIGKNDDNYSGTLGGYLSILNKTNIQFVLTCNHVANPRALIASDAAPEGECNSSIKQLGFPHFRPSSSCFGDPRTISSAKRSQTLNNMRHDVLAIRIMPRALDKQPLTSS